MSGVALAIIGGAAAIGGATYKGIQGAKQRKTARELDPQRPEYQIPEAQMQQLGLYRGLAQQARLPGAAGTIKGKCRCHLGGGLGCSSSTRSAGVTLSAGCFP